MESTNLTFLTPAMLQTAAWTVILVLTDYVAVMLAVAVDLRSGTMRARREGRPRTSRGYRRTVDKASRYFVTLLALTIIDVLLVLSVFLLQATAGIHLPAFPLFTTLGAIGLTLIEVKSVMENSRHRKDLQDAARSVNDLLQDPAITELMERLRELRKGCE